MNNWNILDPIARPLGQFLYFIYNNLAFHYYGLAIIIFTFIVKLVLLPLTVKQYKSSAKMQELQPQIQEIQKRYKNDKEKLNQEMMKIYQENKVNPAGGCLPLLIQLPILFSLYYVVVQPLKFMLVKSQGVVFALRHLSGITAGFTSEIGILRYFSLHPEKFNGSGDIVWQGAKAAGIANGFGINASGQIFEKVNDASKVVVDIGDKLLNHSQLINFKFLGLDLSQNATFQPQILFGPQAGTYLPLLLLPIIGVITTFISTKLSMPRPVDNGKSGGPDMAKSMTNSMLYIGPLMTLYFSFMMPAGVILYWIVGYVFQIFQQLYINKYIMKKKEVAVK